MLTDKEKDMMIREIMEPLKRLCKHHAHSFPRDDWRDLYGYCMELVVGLLDKYNPNNGGTWVGFCMTCVRRRLTDPWRHGERKKRVPNALLDSLDAPVTFEDGVDVLLHETISDSKDILETIITKETIAWVLSHVEDAVDAGIIASRMRSIPYKDIAEIYNIDESTIRRRYAEAKKNLVQKFRRKEWLCELY
jgi:RNA polymerase sigma factor (sigma-70 family)